MKAVDKNLQQKLVFFVKILELQMDSLLSVLILVEWSSLVSDFSYEVSYEVVTVSCKFHGNIIVPFVQ